jgi:hypothetical protein
MAVRFRRFTVWTNKIQGLAFQIQFPGYGDRIKLSLGGRDVAAELRVEVGYGEIACSLARCRLGHWRADYRVHLAEP